MTQCPRDEIMPREGELGIIAMTTQQELSKWV